MRDPVSVLSREIGAIVLANMHCHEISLPLLNSAFHRWRPCVLFLTNVNWQFTILVRALILQLVLPSTIVFKDHHRALSLWPLPCKIDWFALVCSQRSDSTFFKNNHPNLLLFWASFGVRLLPAYSQILKSRSTAAPLCRKVWLGVPSPDTTLVYLYLGA